MRFLTFSGPAAPLPQRGFPCFSLFFIVEGGIAFVKRQMLIFVDL